VQGAIRNSIENQYEENEDRFEPGVYVTYGRASDGSTIFRRVRFKYYFPSFVFAIFFAIINKLVVGFNQPM
jgi:Transcription factor regulating root and shoot growth via Pin3